MKNLQTAVIAVLFSVGMLISPGDAFAQTEPGELQWGAGFVFGTGVGAGILNNDIGVRGDIYYSVTEEIRAGADAAIYRPITVLNETATVWELNLNGHYIFHDEDELMVYALGGLNITGVLTGTDGFEGSADAQAGLNAGAGLEYELEFADVFGEMKLSNLGGSASQFVLGLGFRWPL